MTSKRAKGRQMTMNVINDVYREYQESRTAINPRYSKVAMGVVIALSNWGRA